jgi:uncharacterized protein
MKKTLFFLLLSGLSLAVFYILIRAFPKNAYFMPLLFILMILDGYLWFSVRKSIHNTRRLFQHIVAGLFWFPLILLIATILTSLAVPYLQWNVALRTYIPGIILVVYVCKVFPLTTLAFADIFRVAKYMMNSFLHGKGVHLNYFPRNRFVLSAGWIAGGGLFVLMILGMAWWNHDFRTKHETIVLPELPASFNNLNIVQISDLHLGSWSGRSDLDKAIRIVNDLHPDLVFFTGDIANFSTADVLPYEKELRALKARLGIFAILGNHDYGDYIYWPSAAAKAQDLTDLFDFYKRLGWHLLLNDHYILKNGNDSIAIIGIQNWGRTLRFQRLGDVGKAQQGCENMALQLLLTHDPSNWEYVVSRKYRNIDVSFSGHTHGFQFGIECCGIKWSPAQYLYDYWGGLYSLPVPASHPQYLYVNRGLGSLGYPGRIGILPEITQFTLRKK